MEEDKLSVEEFEDLFGNTPFENIKKTRKYINENYIPKSKVQEKIEELDIRIGECCENIDKTVDEERTYWKKEKRDAIMQRFILQELLD